MRDERELVALANENFAISFTKLAEHCEGGEYRRFGGVVAYASGLPVALFNGCVVVERTSPGDLDEALRWVAGRGPPMRLFVAPEHTERLADVAEQHGLELDAVPYPGMVLHPVAEPPAPAPGVVVDTAGVEELREVGVAPGLGRDLVEKLFSASFLADADVQGFVGRLEGRPVGYSLALRSEGAGGVYNVGTLPEARRRGVGTALTWAAVDAARRWGFDCAVLQSTQMAIPMYEAMGFRTVVRYAVFREPVTPTGHETPVPPSPQ